MKNKDKLRKKRLIYLKKNKEKAKIQSKRYYEENKEEIRKRHKTYYYENHTIVCKRGRDNYRKEINVKKRNTPEAKAKRRIYMSKYWRIVVKPKQAENNN